MNHSEYQYLALLRDILDNGVQQSNRTGIDTLTLPGAMLKFDLREGFPAVTTKKLAFNQVKGELIGFLRGYDNAEQFRALGCTVWDQNANENAQWLGNLHRKGTDDLGRIYGVQWRQWGTRTVQANGDGFTTLYTIDQIENALNEVRQNPTSRRIIVSAWNVGELNQMALPPCHKDFQLLPHVESNTLHMTMSQRSCDMFLGVPFNIASYALLLELFAKWTGYKAGTLTMFLSDAHIYVNHIEQVKEQLDRTPFSFPKLGLSLPPKAQLLSVDELVKLTPDDIWLQDYTHHPAIKAPMAV